MLAEEAEARAERLGATMLLFGVVYESPSDAIDGSNESALLTIEEWEAWRRTDAEDVCLAHACLNAEFERRNRQWDALETLGRVYAAGEGEDATERLLSLPDEGVREALLAAYALGWNFEPPAEE